MSASDAASEPARQSPQARAGQTATSDTTGGDAADEGSPITPTAEAIANYARRGTTVIEKEAGTAPLPPLPRTTDGRIDRVALLATLGREQFGSVPPLAVSGEVAEGQPYVFPSGTEAVHHAVTLRVRALEADDAAGDEAAGDEDAQRGEPLTHLITPVLFRPPGEGPFGCFVFLDHRSQGDETPGEGPEATNYWDVERIVAAGWATVAVQVDEVSPDDRRSDFSTGIHRVAGVPRDPDWTAIAAWAWALSQTRHVVAARPEIDADRLIAIGHSRGGKTALWAGASDAAFAGAVSNNSGCGGAALARRRIGETVRIINTNFPHWFNARHKTYNDREAALPHDEHWLLAAVAPRAIAVGSAAEDYWADPYGEWLALQAAADAWGVDLGSVPAIGASRDVGSLHYHLRPGGHGLLADDWDHYLNWATRVTTK